MILNHLKNKKFTIFYLKYSQFSNHLDSNNFLLEKINNILYIHDRAYGIFKIDNPQIAKILSTQIFKKSLKIMQHGVPGLIGWTAPVSRGEHMIGTYLIVRKLTDNKIEQIASLVHDLSHRTFSHTIDIVFMDTLKGESLHEKKMEDFLKKTDLSESLDNSITINNLLNHKNFTILEQPAPFLCADRGDYSARDMIALGLVDQSFTKQYYEELDLSPENKIFIKSKNFAFEFGRKCIELDRLFYGSTRNLGINHLGAKCIKRALQIGVLQVEEFDIGNCGELWKKIKNCKDDMILSYLLVLEKEIEYIKSKNQLSCFIEIENSRLLDGYLLISENLICKPRCIDPLVKDGNNFRLLSQVNNEFKELLFTHQKKHNKIINLYYK